MTDQHPHSAWRPSGTLENARLRAAMLQSARAFFERHEILEVETPALSIAAASDPNIESIAVESSQASAPRYFLHTSPEFAMKRLLCAGWPDIYQICKVFRDGESGRHHQPEFTMVEWYRHDVSMRSMMEHTARFISQLLDDSQEKPLIRYVRYEQAFLQHAGLNPLTATAAELRAATRADARLGDALGSDRDAWLDYLLSSTVAPRFEKTGLTVLHHYPASQAALARLCPDDARLADRFEIFAGELELANGYHELVSAAEQRRRIEQDQRQRAASGAPQRPIDDRFLSALEAGLPPCCGVAVGLDRLLMLRSGASHIDDVQSFPAVKISHA